LLSERLVALNGKLPSDFNRQPRGLDDRCYWKATEFRSFLIYLAPIVLKGIVSSKVYDHFLALHISISILLRGDFCSNVEMVCSAKELLLWFVNNCKHLADDVTHHGCSLNEISEFKFENYMQLLKKMVKNSNNPLCQIQKRLAEKDFSAPIPKKRKIFVDNGKDIYLLSTEGNVCKITKFFGESNFEYEEQNLLSLNHFTAHGFKQLIIYHH